MKLMKCLTWVSLTMLSLFLVWGELAELHSCYLPDLLKKDMKNSTLNYIYLSLYIKHFFLAGLCLGYTYIDIVDLGYCQ